ncbi:hypothetical protein BVX98_01500 [bacterium F11]|nr:hypothetical protein BVX98_01500 [bacterium F11]
MITDKNLGTNKRDATFDMAGGLVLPFNDTTRFELRHEMSDFDTEVTTQDSSIQNRTRAIFHFEMPQPIWGVSHAVDLEWAQRDLNFIGTSLVSKDYTEDLLSVKIRSKF